MEKDIMFGNENLFSEVKTTLNMEDYTGDNAPLKCFNVESNEYAISKEGEEIFASVDADTVIVSIKGNEKIMIKGDINALEAFSFLYQMNYLDCDRMYIFSNNDFDIEVFKGLRKEISEDEIIFEELNDKDFECCVDVIDNQIKISNGKGSIINYEIDNDIEDERKRTL